MHVFIHVNSYMDINICINMHYSEACLANSIVIAAKIYHEYMNAIQIYYFYELRYVASFDSR
jgi:hypothetical protein